MLRKGYGGLYKAPTEEERRKRMVKRGETSQIKFIVLRFNYVEEKEGEGEMR